MRLQDFSLYCEAKKEYLELRKKGIGRADTIKEMQEHFADEISIGSEDDGILFWLALADAQYSMKELSSEVAAYGLQFLDALEHSDLSIASGELVRRRERYAQAPMPEKKSVRSRPIFHCGWSVGDTFAYRLSGPDADAAGISGKTVLFRKVGEVEFDHGHIVPLVTLTLWETDNLPQNSAELGLKPVLLLRCTKLLTHIRKDYVAVLPFTSKRQLDKLKFLFIGNYPDIPSPAEQTVYDIGGKYPMILPSMVDKKCCIFVQMDHSHLTD